MRYRDRPYDDSAGDFSRLWQFLVRDYAERGGEFSWTVGRMTDWKYNLATERKLSPLFLPATAHLWFDDLDELIAFAINENVGHELAAFTRRGWEHLYGPVVEWSTENWRRHARSVSSETALVHSLPAASELIVYQLETERHEATYLGAHGWQDLGWVATTRRFDVQVCAARGVRVPEGFSIVSLAEDPNYASKLVLHHDAWGHGPVNSIDLELFDYCRTAPTYDPRLDISVVAPNGEHVAGCTAFPDFANSYAEIERVCARSDFRRRGLATAAIEGCFQALADFGLRNAYLTGDSDPAISLYSKLGHIGEWHTRAWRLIV